MSVSEFAVMIQTTLIVIKVIHSNPFLMLPGVGDDVGRVFHAVLHHVRDAECEEGDDADGHQQNRQFLDDVTFVE